MVILQDVGFREARTQKSHSSVEIGLHRLHRRIYAYAKSRLKTFLSNDRFYLA